MKKITSLIVIAFLIIIAGCLSTPPVVSTGEVIEKAEEKISQIDLYVFAIGINEYQNKFFPDLKYAANDAKNICNFFKAQEGIFFRKVNTKLFSDNENMKPTTENILDNLYFFDDVSPYDTVIFYIASHRIINDGEFYLMTSDSEYNEDEGFVLESFINFNQILNALNKPSHKIIIIDTNSPEITREDITFIKACKDNQQAIESNLVNGGLLTASLLEAFEKAETGNNNEITLKSLLNFVVNRVEELSDKKQTPVFNIASGADDLIIGSRINLKSIGINIPSIP